jgi:hypothetical protein
MKKNLKKLALNRETLAPLQSLEDVVGGNQGATSATITVTIQSCFTLPICCQQSISHSVSFSAPGGGGAAK